MHTRVGIVSDLHGIILDPATLPALDILIFCGDNAPHESIPLRYMVTDAEWIRAVQRQRELQFVWYRDAFLPALIQTNTKITHIFWTFGNHDFVGEDPALLAQMKTWSLPPTIDETVTARDLRIWLSPWTPTFQDWAWMDHDSVLGNNVYSQMPHDLDIVITHGPAYGTLDSIGFGHLGSESLYRELRERDVSLHAFGHIHPPFGYRPPLRGSRMWSANAAMIDPTYDLHGEIIVAEFDGRECVDVHTEKLT